MQVLYLPQPSHWISLPPVSDSSYRYSMCITIRRGRAWIRPDLPNLSPLRPVHSLLLHLPTPHQAPLTRNIQSETRPSDILPSPSLQTQTSQSPSPSFIPRNTKVGILTLESYSLKNSSVLNRFPTTARKVSYPTRASVVLLTSGSRFRNSRNLDRDSAACWNAVFERRKETRFSGLPER